MAKSVAELPREAAAALERGQGTGLQQTASPSEPKVAVSESQPQPRPGNREPLPWQERPFKVGRWLAS